MNNYVIAVVGAKGKMGSSVCKKLQNRYKIIEIDVENSLNDAKFANLIIDFSDGSSSVKTTKFCAKNKIPLIIGATGQNEEEIQQIESFSKNIPILICKNFSMGIFLEKKICEMILSFVKPSITIIEKHHLEKKDSPSGTALDLKNHINKITKSKVSILSERGGKEIGTHQIDFYFNDELISVKHQAFTREAFSDGVEIATKFMLTCKINGLYNFDEIINNKINA